VTADITLGQERQARALPRLPRVDAAAIGAWLLPFSAVLYLALDGGGYTTVVRGQVGIALWWMVLVGAVVGALPFALSRRAWGTVALLGGLLAWTALSLSWTESDERTVTEIGRVAMLLGALVLGLATVGQTRRKQVTDGVAAAIGLVALLAVLSRLHPAWFPALSEFENPKRLSYPVHYWNALAAFVVMGVPALLAVAGGARTLLARSFAAAALPVAALCVFLTVSRGGLISLALVPLAFVALAPDRLPKLATLIAGGIGGSVLVLAADARPALRDGLGNALAHHQGDDVLMILALVCAGTALLQLAISLVDRHATRLRWLMVPRRRAAAGIVGALALAAVIAVVAGAPGASQRAWEEFKQPQAAASVGGDTTFQRLGSASGSGRYQYWQANVRAQQTRPLGGRGAGTFEYWWARTRGEAGGYVRDAHSLYLQTYGELGLVGLVLIAGFFLVLLGSGVARSFTARVEDQLPIAAATAGILGFALMASVEWIWQIAVLPVTLMLLGAVVLSGQRRLPGSGATGKRGRIAAVALAIVCLPAIAISLAGASGVAESQAAAGRGDLAGALREARSAVRVQPYAASPRLQEALILEQAGKLPLAASAAAEATAREPTNWRPWLIRSRIEAEQGHARASVKLFRMARSLNPQSPIFAKQP
jgi:hypothetical protein